MDALREYYEFVFLLDDLLEVIIGGQLLDQLNLRGAYSDVLVVSNQESIQQLQDLQMIKSEQTYDQFMVQIEKILTEKNSLGFKFHFKGDFFRQEKLRYLYDLVGEEYFRTLMKCFHIYRIDSSFNCYLQFGRYVVEDHKLPVIKRKLVDEKRMCLESNQAFCRANGQTLGALRRPKERVDKFADNNEDKILKELKHLHGFLDETGDSILTFLVDKAKRIKLSHLRNPRMTNKLHYYTCEFVDDRLDRQRIYENPSLLEAKEQFQQQFDNTKNAESLFEQIFQRDEDVKSIFKRHSRIRDQVLDYLNSFMIEHKSCDFSSLLMDACPVSEFFNHGPVSNEPYDPSDHLLAITKQDQVCNYMKSVLQCVLPQQLFGAENFKVICHWFNLIPFQNSNVELYYSTVHYMCDLSRVEWLKDQSASFKVRAIHWLIKWLSDYMIGLLRFSFYTVKDLRLRFYRFDYWMQIKGKQLSDWARHGKIETNRYEHEMEGQHNLPVCLDFDIKPLLDFIQIHSTVPAGDLEFERQIKCIGVVLKAICNDQTNLFKSEIDFYNRIKSFYLTKQNQRQFSYFKLEFEDQLPNVSQDFLVKILGDKLTSFCAKYQVEQIEVRQAVLFNKARHMKKKEVHYVNLPGLEMLEKLRLSGCWDLANNSLVNVLDFRVCLAKEFVYELVYKFIKTHRLQVNETDYIRMKDGLSFNEHLSQQLLALYTNDLIEKSIPHLADDDNLLVCCEHDRLIVFATSEESARQHFNSIVRHMSDYKLNFRIKHSHIYNISGFEDVAESMCRQCYYGNFNLRLEPFKLPIFQYKNSVLDVKNIKSSFSFHLWAHPDEFKTQLIQSWLDNFRFFNFDQSVLPAETVMMNVFKHFSLFAIQTLYFFDNTLLLSRDENPKLIFELIFDLLYNFIHQLKYQIKLMPNFKITVDFFTLLWLLVRTFKITWHKLKRSRVIENETIQQLEQWTEPYVKNLDELNAFDLESTWSENLRAMDFCISRGGPRNY